VAHADLPGPSNDAEAALTTTPFAELEVSAANLQGGGGRAVRLLSGLCVPFRLLLLRVVHASQCPVPFEGRTFEALPAGLSSRDVGPIWDCPGHSAQTWGVPAKPKHTDLGSTGKAQAPHRAVTGAATLRCTMDDGRIRAILKHLSPGLHGTISQQLEP
jgi:hypothetical protein